MVEKQQTFAVKRKKISFVWFTGKYLIHDFGIQFIFLTTFIKLTKIYFRSYFSMTKNHCPRKNQDEFLNKEGTV